MTDYNRDVTQDIVDNWPKSPDDDRCGDPADWGDEACCPCPRCGESDVDALIWDDEGMVECATCGAYYNPDDPDELKTVAPDGTIASIDPADRALLQRAYEADDGQITEWNEDIGGYVVF